MSKAIEQLQNGLLVGHAGLGMHGAAVGSVRQVVHDGDTINTRLIGNLGTRFLVGEGEGPGMAQQRSPLNEDPLGRPRRTEGPDLGSQVKVPDEIDVQRARRILDELRRRFSDPGRPRLELDYLERLLKNY